MYIEEFIFCKYAKLNKCKKFKMTKFKTALLKECTLAVQPRRRSALATTMENDRADNGYVVLQSSPLDVSPEPDENSDLLAPMPRGFRYGQLPIRIVLRAKSTPTSCGLDFILPRDSSCAELWHSCRSRILLTPSL